MAIRMMREAAALQHPAGRHVPPEIPLPSGGREIVVNHSTRAGGGMENPVVSHVDGHVVHRGSGAGKKKKISGLKRLDIEGHGGPGGGLFPRRARKVDPVSSVHILHESGAIEA
jgi:hypothetical protein